MLGISSRAQGWQFLPVLRPVATVASVGFWFIKEFPEHRQLAFRARFDVSAKLLGLVEGHSIRISPHACA